MLNTVTPSGLITLLTPMIAARLPALVTGPPGVGKSDLVAQAAKAAGAELILSHPAVADPTDAKGLPWAEPGATEATFLPYGDLARAIAAERPTVWFLDDLGQAPPAVQASYMQLLLARRVGPHQLPGYITFIAATNRRTDRAGVGGILEPVKSRFATIVELQASLCDWCDWAISRKLPAELIAFLRFRPDLLSAFEASADMSNSPSPRTWARVAQLLALDLPADLTTTAIAGAVGEGAALEFAAFRSMYRDLPSIDGILRDPYGARIPREPSALYATCTAVAMRADPTTVGHAAQYAQRLHDTARGEFAALLLRDLLQRQPSAAHSPDVVALMSGDLGSLIIGD